MLRVNTRQYERDIDRNTTINTDIITYFTLTEDIHFRDLNYCRRTHKHPCLCVPYCDRYFVFWNI